MVLSNTIFHLRCKTLMLYAWGIWPLFCSYHVGLADVVIIPWGWQEMLSYPIKWVNHNGWIDIFVIKKTTLFVRIFDISPCVFTQISIRDLVGCVIWFCIQRVPTLHTSEGPCYPKNNKYLKTRDDDIIITLFQIFLVFGVAGSVKNMQCGHALDAESNFASNEPSQSKFG